MSYLICAHFCAATTPVCVYEEKTQPFSSMSFVFFLHFRVLWFSMIPSWVEMRLNPVLPGLGLSTIWIQDNIRHCLIPTLPNEPPSPSRRKTRALTLVGMALDTGSDADKFACRRVPPLSASTNCSSEPPQRGRENHSFLLPSHASGLGNKTRARALMRLLSLS